MSFECEHCGCKNNEIQSGDKVQEKGALIKCVITSSKDMNRQIIKSDYATVKIPEIEFEIPPQSKRGGDTPNIIFRNNFITNYIYLQKLQLLRVS